MLYLYLDESGDLGFDFVNKKPSKYFVVTILAVKGSETNRRLINGVKKTLKRKLNPKNKRKRIVEELKGTKTTIEIKDYFYKQISDLDFAVYSIVLNKRRVYQSLVKQKSRVYNFIARQVLDQIPYGNAEQKVELTIDKSKSKPEIVEFNQYIYRELESKIDPAVPLNIYHVNSIENCALQAVDLFSYAVFEKHERRKKEWYDIIKGKIRYDSIYLPDK
ncbi:MAG: hypothetical protein CVU55_09805 [Deltaproteobacteria bacterium HGW-Deltaproteobacteria-13]|jgi:uncharacterized protein YwqG|nr:MAG: hypothetical protein CVU55_09805 [Deltaproteobacteria bacterium HGW-Deltaproteobacteria-13]